MPITSSARRVSACVSLILALSVCADAQSITVAWDATPATTDPQTNPAGYIVYWGTQSGVYPNQSNVGNVLQHVIPALADGTRYYVRVAAYNEANVVGAQSPEVSGLAPMPPPPPPPPPLETCGPDGLGNGVDEDLDGEIDEVCLPPPSDVTGPYISSFTIGRRTGNNFPVTVNTSDPSGIDRVEFWVDDQMRVRLSAPTSGLTMYAARVQIKNPGIYTVTVKSVDIHRNTSTHSLEVRR